MRTKKMVQMPRRELFSISTRSISNASESNERSPSAQKTSLKA
jgi:hypothetical protein